MNIRWLVPRLMVVIAVLTAWYFFSVKALQFLPPIVVTLGFFSTMLHPNPKGMLVIFGVIFLGSWLGSAYLDFPPEEIPGIWMLIFTIFSQIVSLASNGETKANTWFEATMCSLIALAFHGVYLVEIDLFYAIVFLRGTLTIAALTTVTLLFKEGVRLHPFRGIIIAALLVFAAFLQWVGPVGLCITALVQWRQS